MKRYNEKQTHSDRCIPNYYKKICSGNQEKPFHEIILQVGSQDDVRATGEYAQLARTVLDEYYQGFQAQNPNLRVFSAHLHMDEATPHLHIDFVPFTTGSEGSLYLGRLSMYFSSCSAISAVLFCIPAWHVPSPSGRVCG